MNWTNVGEGGEKHEPRSIFKLSYCNEYTLTHLQSGFWQDSGYSTDLDRLGLS